MRKYKSFTMILFSLVLCIGLLTATACTKKNETIEQQEGNMPSEGNRPVGVIEQDANTIGEKIESTLAQKKQEYETAMEARLTEYDNKMAELKNKAANAAQDTKAEMDQLIAELAVKREEAQKKLDELKAAGEDSWENFKAGLDTAVDDLQKSCDQAISRFQEK
ncbi:MAG: hypothetical protein AB1611_14460 [bacterium]